MPPIVPRKRLWDADRTPTPKKPSDRTSNHQPLPRGTPAKAKRDDSYLKDLEAAQADDADSSSLSSLSDEDFEDVPLAKKRRLAKPADDDSEDEDEDDDIEFEDVDTFYQASAPEAPVHSGDLVLNLDWNTRIDLTNPFGDKKGPSKQERLIRHSTHRVHVQCLMWHNALRNSWLCDPEVQGTMVSHISVRVYDEILRWRKASGLYMEPEAADKMQATAKGKMTANKGKGKGKAAMKSTPKKSARDWGGAAERLERGAVDMSHGDPLFRLMKVLTAWWKQRFKITAPGIRKVGYMSLERLDRLTKSFAKDGSDAEAFGERIRNLHEFRLRARLCSGSRDVGAQLFTALLRGLGLEARMVATLQPLGFGWMKLEDADPEKEELSANGTHVDSDASPAPSTKPKATPLGHPKAQPDAQDPDQFGLAEINSDDDSVVEIPRLSPKEHKRQVYDKELKFPHYWTEVLSPVTQKYLVVDPVVKHVVATNRELVESLEPRGGKADKEREVMAYVVGYSQDGTAKDVTVRYLKRQTLPGRTKGMRIPVEKVPLYNKHGKVKRYEQHDWFRTVMRGYERGGVKHPLTEADEDEASTDLKPRKPEKKEVKEGGETLQYFKQSKEFALARHLKREEALVPSAEPVKVFHGKGKGKGAAAEEENVYLRKDVVTVKSAETWHKQGRAPIEGEQPLKRVSYRAATTNRRREIAEVEAKTGTKVLQGLYSFDQTDWIIPPPIEKGVIPKNDYGNIDLFAEHMCPEGAVHIPHRGCVKICRRMGIDCAEAVVGFEFGHRMAVPVIQGVVIAEEFHDQVMEELAKDEAERMRKEDEKRRKAAMGMWRRMLMGLRIMKRIRTDYGEIGQAESVFEPVHDPTAVDLGRKGDGGREEDMAGGFFPEGHEEEEPDGRAVHTSSFFPATNDDGDEDDHPLVVEDANKGEPPATESSRAGAEGLLSDAAASRQRRSRRAPSSPAEAEKDKDEDMEGDSAS